MKKVKGESIMTYTGKFADIHTHAEAGNLNEDFEVLNGFDRLGIL